MKPDRAHNFDPERMAIDDLFDLGDLGAELNQPGGFKRETWNSIKAFLSPGCDWTPTEIGRLNVREAKEFLDEVMSTLNKPGDTIPLPSETSSGSTEPVTPIESPPGSTP